LAGQSQTVKRIYIANDDHTDYMWTANEAQYDTAFVKMLDYYLLQIDSTKDNPSDFQARFICAVCLPLVFLAKIKKGEVVDVSSAH
jgi:alpha-mannosidase